jgi:hypothetical protein
MRTMPPLTAGKGASQRESLLKKRVKTIKFSDLTNYSRKMVEPIAWEQARELRRIMRELPLKEIEQWAREEVQSGGRGYKWSRIYAERTLLQADKRKGGPLAE